MHRDDIRVDKKRIYKLMKEGGLLRKNYKAIGKPTKSKLRAKRPLQFFKKNRCDKIYDYGFRMGLW